jgi:hypothetical protein
MSHPERRTPHALHLYNNARPNRKGTEVCQQTQRGNHEVPTEARKNLFLTLGHRDLEGAAAKTLA